MEAHSAHAVQGGVDYDKLFGEITCDEGEGFLIVGRITDSLSYEGKGRTRGVCTGESQSWSIRDDRRVGGR